jgi:hypothetical protein
MDMSYADFVSDTFVANVATLLGISANRIVIANVRAGSVIVDFQIIPELISSSVPGTNSTDPPVDVTAQFVDLQALAATFTTKGNNHCPKMYSY